MGRHPGEVERPIPGVGGEGGGWTMSKIRRLILVDLAALRPIEA
jgi:hypothetical protein